MLPALSKAGRSSAPRILWRRCFSGHASIRVPLSKGKAVQEEFGNPNKDKHERRSFCANFSRQYRAVWAREELHQRHSQLSHLQQVRTNTKVAGSDLKTGNFIERKGRVYQVLSAQHTTQGRGGATVQVELRDVKNGLKTGERFRTSEMIERVFVEEKTYTFLFDDERGEIVLMDPDTFEQVMIPKDLLGHTSVYLQDGMQVIVKYFDGTPLSASVPPVVKCSVVATEPFFKGQAAVAMYKRVVLENGLEIQAPPFVEVGQSIFVNPADNTYMGRAK